MTSEKPKGDAAKEIERATKILQTTENQVIRARTLGKDIARIKRVNGIAAALNARYGKAS
jgi:hypothetical protein